MSRDEVKQDPDGKVTQEAADEVDQTEAILGAPRQKQLSQSLMATIDEDKEVVDVELGRTTSSDMPVGYKADGKNVKVVKINLTEKVESLPNEPPIGVLPEDANETTEVNDTRKANPTHAPECHPGDIDPSRRSRQKQVIWVATVILTVILLAIVGVSVILSRKKEHTDDTQTPSQPAIATSTPPTTPSFTGIPSSTSTDAIETTATIEETTPSTTSSVASTAATTTATTTTSTIEVPTTSWLQRGIDLDTTAMDLALSFDGSILAAGMPQDDEKGNYAGGVRVFEWKHMLEEWEQLGQTLYPSDPQSDGSFSFITFGGSVALNREGSTLAVGATRQDTPSGPGSGRVQVFRFNGTSASWAPRGEPIDGVRYAEALGFSLSLSDDGELLAVGALDGSKIGAGLVRVYRYLVSTGEWTQLGSDIEGSRKDDLFGMSVSLSENGQTLAIGAPSYAGASGLQFAAGLVRIFEWDEPSEEWEQVGQDLDGTKLYGQYGNSVSHSGQDNRLRVVSGDFFASTVRVYDYNSTEGQWDLAGKTITSENRNEWFGHSVSLSDDGNTLAVSSRKAREGRGATRMYQWIEEAQDWLPLENEPIVDETDDHSTSDMVLSGNGRVLTVGASPNGGVASNAGHVRVYERTSET